MRDNLLEGDRFTQQKPEDYCENLVGKLQRTTVNIVKQRFPRFMDQTDLTAKRINDPDRLLYLIRLVATAENEDWLKFALETIIY